MKSIFIVLLIIATGCVMYINNHYPLLRDPMFEENWVKITASKEQLDAHFLDSLYFKCTEVRKTQICPNVEDVKKTFSKTLKADYIFLVCYSVLFIMYIFYIFPRGRQQKYWLNIPVWFLLVTIVLITMVADILDNYSLSSYLFHNQLRLGLMHASNAVKMLGFYFLLIFLVVLRPVCLMKYLGEALGVCREKIN